MAFPIDSPLPIFYDANGSVLDAGYVYIGAVNQNPELVPAAVFWDAAQTQPAPQPLRTVRGFISRSGAPAEVFVNSDFSMTVRDRNKALILYAADSSAIDRIQSVIGQQSFDALASLRASGVPTVPSGQTRVVSVLSHTAGTGVGGGQFRWDATSTSTDDNALVVNPAGNPGAGRWLRMYDGDAMVTFWGAVGDGVTDDTAAIQAAVTWAVGTVDGVGKGLLFPTRSAPNTVGNYRISAAITIGRSQGWRLHGSSRFGTKITQATNNTPIFDLTRELTHSWNIMDINLEWANQQTSAQTQSLGVRFNANAFTGSGFFKWGLERINFNKGYELCALNTATVNQIAWSCWINDINLVNFSGGLCTLLPSPSFGQPGISIGNIYGAFPIGNVANKYFISLGEALGFTIDNVELNQATDMLGYFIRGSNGHIGAFRCESIQITTAAADQVVYLHQNSDITVGTLEWAGGSFDTGANASLFMVNNNGTNGNANIGHLQINGTVSYTSGALVGVRDSTVNRQVKIERFEQSSGSSAVPTGLARISNTSGSDFTKVRNWTEDNLSFNKGTTTPIQLVVGDPPVQYYSTAITADQVIRLPDVAGTVVGTQTIANAVQGLRYRIVRTSTATGAFNINVQTSTGAALHTLAAAANAVEFMWNRTAGWVKVEAGTIA